MDFLKTGLPDRQILRASFEAGFERYAAIFSEKPCVETAYMRGPVAMARLILDRGGDCHETAVAACLAGPALFSADPDSRINKMVLKLSHEILSVEDAEATILHRFIPHLSDDAKLFLQASAIMALEDMVRECGDVGCNDTLQKAYIEILQLYSVARGVQDTYRLDTRFEIAAMKVTTVLDSRSHLWVRARVPVVEMVEA